MAPRLPVMRQPRGSDEHYKRRRRPCGASSAIAAPVRPALRGNKTRGSKSHRLTCPARPNVLWTGSFQTGSFQLGVWEIIGMHVGNVETGEKTAVKVASDPDRVRPRDFAPCLERSCGLGGGRTAAPGSVRRRRRATQCLAACKHGASAAMRSRASGPAQPRSVAANNRSARALGSGGPKGPMV